MGLIATFGDFGVGDIVSDAQDLYDLLLDLCQDQLEWNNVLNKPELYTKSETYNKAEVNALITAADPGDHTHSITEVTGLQDAIDERYTKTETDTLLDDKADTDHTHTTADITGLDAAIAALGVQIVEALPSPVVNGRVYILHNAGENRFKAFISAHGGYVALDAVTYSALSLALAAYQTKLTGLPTQYVKGDGTYGLFNKAAIGLGNVANIPPSQYPISDAQAAALAQKSNNSDVLHKDGNETKTSGVLSFVLSPTVPVPTNSPDAANKGYVDTVFSQVPQHGEFEITDPSEVWLWNHGFNYKPSVRVLLSGVEVLAYVEHLDNDNLRIEFPVPQTGVILY